MAFGGLAPLFRHRLDRRVPLHRNWRLAFSLKYLKRFLTIRLPHWSATTKIARNTCVPACRKSIASEEQARENDDFCCTILIFEPNFESCYIFSDEILILVLFYTPELRFPALFRNYGGARCSTIPKNGRKSESCNIYGGVQRTEAAGICHTTEFACSPTRKPNFAHFFSPNGEPIKQPAYETLLII